MTAPLKVHLIAAARPNFMKVAPLYHVLQRAPWCAPVLVHTGQHYDHNMSGAFLAELGLPAPDHHLGIGSMPISCSASTSASSGSRTRRLLRPPPSP